MTDIHSGTVESSPESLTGSAPANAAPSDLSLVIVNLLKGVVYRDAHESLWTPLLTLRNQVSDHMAVIGLTVEIDEAEGYAYLRTRETDDDRTQLPRLIARRTLSFHLSVLLALLRKRLAEFDANSAEVRLVLTRDQILEMMRLFMPDSSNDARLVDQIEADINKAVDLGFLRRLRNEPNVFELRRIIKAYVDGQWLSDFDTRLREYHEQLAGTGETN